MKKKIKTIGILCSGGDSPGMNCAIRSVVRSAIGKGMHPIGIERGYTGILEKKFHNMTLSSVGNIIQRGGTILFTSRCKDFLKIAVRKKAYEILKQKGIEALIVIGGNGSFNGAIKLHEEHHIPVIGIPGTIDNDIANCDYTIGFSTAVQTGVDAVDKIRDTASSHDRNFIIEVMGRKSPYIAMQVGVCTGAENIITPSIGPVDYKEVASDIKKGIARGKNSSIIIVAEGKSSGLSYNIHEVLATQYDIKTRVCILGHIQRGGSPTAIDRIIASEMGLCAINTLLKGDVASAVVVEKGRVKSIPLNKCLEPKKFSNFYQVDLAKALAI